MSMGWVGGGELNPMPSGKLSTALAAGETRNSSMKSSIVSCVNHPRTMGLGFAHMSILSGARSSKDASVKPQRTVGVGTEKLDTGIRNGCVLSFGLEFIRPAMTLQSTCLPPLSSWEIGNSESVHCAHCVATRRAEGGM